MFCVVLIQIFVKLVFSFVDLTGIYQITKLPVNTVCITIFVLCIREGIIDLIFPSASLAMARTKSLMVRIT